MHTILFFKKKSLIDPFEIKRAHAQGCGREKEREGENLKPDSRSLWGPFSGS